MAEEEHDENLDEIANVNDQEMQVGIDALTEQLRQGAALCKQNSFVVTFSLDMHSLMMKRATLNCGGHLCPAPNHHDSKVSLI